MLVAAGAFSVIGAIVYGFSISTLVLFTKNSAVNRSHSDVRNALDTMSYRLQAAENVPTLIKADGTAPTSPDGPAAGMVFDRFLGEPYLLDPPLVATTIAAGAVTLKIWRSTHALASPPIPSPSDAVVIDLPDGVTTVRARVQSVAAGAIDTVNKRQMITLTLAAGTTRPLVWGTGAVQVARLVRTQAFMVFPAATGSSELRYYDTFEPAPVLATATNYTVLTDQLGATGAEATPFSLANMDQDTAITTTSDRVLVSTLTARMRDATNSLTGKQSNSFNTFARLNLRLPSRIRSN